MTPEMQAELDRLWAMPRGEVTSTDIAGDIRLADGPSFVSQFRAIVTDEIYAFEKPGDDPPVIVDCGANIGLATRWWLSRWPDARIEAFEPDPDVFAILQANLAGVPDTVRLHQVALAAEAGTATFDRLGSDAGRLDDRAQGPTATTVPTVTLSSVLADLEHVDLLKIDIEGAEVEVLHEAEHLLGRVDRVFVEYHSRVGERQQLGNLLNLLRRAGFRYYMEVPRTSQRPFVSVSQEVDMDVLVEIWAHRIETPR
ncbi:FkbM family methyltransferase [Cellulomonas sp. B6]|uniref:FkbM family methyltransferase n=1 Tax=Cellulomonas sp. B6 TaxID=1295626 RepID=UPI00073BAF5A|nr:FkbM family methyltransferase [Cellulomonas sp. B6]KSW30065.1 hypothetical protein ATM99_04875 [Cellulomonas sp. B6]